MLKFLIFRELLAESVFFGQLRLALFANSCAVTYRACIFLTDTENFLFNV